MQEFGEKAPKVADLAGLEMHLIGHLQSNKANKAAELFQAVDSVDSLKLAERLNAAAEKLGKKLPVLIEVNVGGEEAKTGVAPSVDEICTILLAAPTLANLEFRGIMTVPPYTEDPEGARLYLSQATRVARSSGETARRSARRAVDGNVARL